MTTKPSPAERDLRRILDAIRHPAVKGVADWIMKDPKLHCVRSVNVKEAADFLDTESLQILESASGCTKSAILLEAAEITAECQESNLNIYAVFALFTYCDCVARHLMRSGVALDDAATVRLIGSYGRRLGSDTVYPTFSINRDDVEHQNEGQYLFIKTVAPQVRRRKFAFFGETASADAYRLLLAQAALVSLDAEELAELRSVMEPQWTIPAGPRPAPPKPVDDRQSKVARPAHIPEDAWEEAWQSFQRGSRAVNRQPGLRPTTQAMWVIQDALEPEVDGPPMTDEDIAAQLEASRCSSIWWHRTWPVHGRPEATSYLGGLPRLAPDLVWPRSWRDDTALPLGAQIDCSQIPGIPGSEAMPRSGTLYFFVNPHVEDRRGDYWGRVLYSPVPTNQLPVSSAPENPRRCFEDGYIVSGYDEWIDPELMPERIPTVFEQWEIKPLLIGSWQGAIFRTISRQLYRGHDVAKSDAIHRRIEQIMRAVKRRDQERALGRPVPDRPAGSGIAGLNALQSGYPWTWLFVLIHASGILRSTRHHIAGLNDSRQANRYPAAHATNLRDLFPVIGEEADGWVMQALEHAPEAPVEASGRESFLAWLHSLETRVSFAKDWYEARSFSATARVDETANCGARTLLATVPDAHKLLPPEYLKLSRFQADNGTYGFHQTLGHGKNEQGQADRLARDHLLLMQLDTDYRIKWMWGDCGTLQFWIKPEDLAERRFGTVTVTMAGG